MALFTSVCGPQGLTDQLNGQLISVSKTDLPTQATFSSIFQSVCSVVVGPLRPSAISC